MRALVAPLESFRTREARSGTQGQVTERLPLGLGFSLREPRNDSMFVLRV
jgi:hypothetical protein